MEHLTTIVKKHVELTATAATKNQVFVIQGVNRDGGGNTVKKVFFFHVSACLLYNNSWSALYLDMCVSSQSILQKKKMLFFYIPVNLQVNWPSQIRILEQLNQNCYLAKCVVISAHNIIKKKILLNHSCSLYV